MPTDMVELPGSRHEPPFGMRRLDRVPEDQPITVSLYLKPRSGGVRAGTQMTRPALRSQREAEHGHDISAVADFVRTAGLQIMEQDAARRLVRIKGPADAVEKAFGAEIHHYEMANGAVCRGRSGPLHLPAGIVDRVIAVLGLDTTPIATSKIVPHRGTTPPPGFLPTEVASLYGFNETDATGRCIAIIELGGGYKAADNAAAFEAMGLSVPDVVAVAVDGGANNPGDGSGADGEVALDIQVAGGLARGARLAVYFAANTSQGFADAISQAIHDDNNKPSAVSISWGSAEDGWSAQSISAMHQAFEDAATLGLTVCAASGDGLATDGESDGKAHVDYPAADPLVLGCGGTKITASGGAITDEVVWKSNGGGTGGGVSTLFAKPAYQASVDVPAASTSKGGRGVPDVSGNADPDSGYRIVTGGQTSIVGGTSAVAPLWAAIAVVLSKDRGGSLGDAHAALYAASDTLRDITVGDNKSGDIGYVAGPGWDPCTGLGSPQGAKLVSALGQTSG